MSRRRDTADTAHRGRILPVDPSREHNCRCIPAFAKGKRYEAKPFRWVCDALFAVRTRICLPAELPIRFGGSRRIRSFYRSGLHEPRGCRVVLLILGSVGVAKAALPKTFALGSGENGLRAQADAEKEFSARMRIRRGGFFRGTIRRLGLPAIIKRKNPRGNISARIFIYGSMNIRRGYLRLFPARASAVKEIV